MYYQSYHTCSTRKSRCTGSAAQRRKEGRKEAGPDGSRIMQDMPSQGYHVIAEQTHRHPGPRYRRGIQDDAMQRSQNGGLAADRKDSPERARSGRAGQMCTLPPTRTGKRKQTPTRSGQILGRARGTGSGGPTSMGLAWRLAGVGACHPTSLFGRLLGRTCCAVLC